MWVYVHSVCVCVHTHTRVYVYVSRVTVLHSLEKYKVGKLNSGASIDTHQ